MTKPQSALLFPLLLVFYEIATYLSNDMYLPALPQMMRELHLDDKQAQLTLTMWFLGQASMPLLIGAISDRFGRRPVLLIGGIFYVLATLACALSFNASSLLLARLIEGGMVASMLVPGYACIHELYDQKEAIRILAFMGSISVLAPAFGPLLGSLILYITHWRGIFWIIAVCAAIVLILLAKWMPETLPSEKRHPIQLSSLFTHYWRVITNKKFMLLIMVIGFEFAGFLAWVTAGPLLVIEDFHYSPLAFGFIQAAVFIAYILGNRVVKYVLNWFDIHLVVHLGLSIALIGGLLGLGLALCFPTSLFPFLAALMLYSFGSALCFSPLNRLIIETSTEPMGVRVSIFAVFMTSFAALGSGMSSLFFNGSLVSLASLIAIVISIACLMKIAVRS